MKAKKTKRAAETPRAEEKPNMIEETESAAAVPASPVPSLPPPTGQGELDYRRLREMLDAGMQDALGHTDGAFNKMKQFQEASEVNARMAEQKAERAAEVRDAEDYEKGGGATLQRMLEDAQRVRQIADDAERPPTLSELADREQDHARKWEEAREAVRAALAEYEAHCAELETLDAGIAAIDSSLRDLDAAERAASDRLRDAYREHKDPDGIAAELERIITRQAVAKRKLEAAQAVRREVNEKAEPRRRALGEANRDCALAETLHARARFAASAMPLVAKMAEELKPLLEEFRQVGERVHTPGAFNARLNRIVPRDADTEKVFGPVAILAQAINDALTGEK